MTEAERILTYSGVHMRLRAKRGLAVQFKCVSCDKQAEEWAHQGEGKYSQDLAFYAPMCRSCHRKLDHHRPTHCPKGHAYEGDNLYVAPKGDRRCRECHRQQQRQRRHPD